MLYYETIEKGSEYDWVVFIHGMCGNTRTWKRQIDDFKNNYNLLFIDLIGHGKSIDKKGYHDFINMQSNIKEVLDFLNIKKAHFVGLSLGTIVLVFFALIYPETVKSLVLGGAVTKLMTAGRLVLSLAQKVKNFLPKKLLCIIFARVLIPEKNNKVARKVFLREALKMKKTEISKWIETLKILHFSDTYLKLFKKLKNIPVLYVMGSRDYIFLKGTKSTSEEIKHTKLKIIEDCGHVCTIEKYKEFNNLALNFLNKIKRKNR